VHRQVLTAIESGKISANDSKFAATASSFEQTKAMVRQVDEALWAVQVHRTNHPRSASIDFARALIQTFDISAQKASGFYS
jgi:hypothetical protein